MCVYERESKAVVYSEKESEIKIGIGIERKKSVRHKVIKRDIKIERQRDGKLEWVLS